MQLANRVAAVAEADEDNNFQSFHMVMLSNIEIVDSGCILYTVV